MCAQHLTCCMYCAQQAKMAHCTEAGWAAWTDQPQTTTQRVLSTPRHTHMVASGPLRTPRHRPMTPPALLPGCAHKLPTTNHATPQPQQPAGPQHVKPAACYRGRGGDKRRCSKFHPSLCLMACAHTPLPCKVCNDTTTAGRGVGAHNISRHEVHTPVP